MKTTSEIDHADKRPIVAPGVRIPAASSVLSRIAGDSDPAWLDGVNGGAAPPSPTLEHSRDALGSMR